MYKETKWANRILMLQEKNGLWGYFHTLSEPSKGHPITTEQALRRLKILGYTIDDEPIQRAVKYMDECLQGKRQMPDKQEKTHDWDIFTDLILSTWVRRFTTDCEAANQVARQWVGVITSAFSKGEYYNHDYILAYQNAFGKSPEGGRLIDFVNFYQVSLIAGQLDENTESAVFDYIMKHKGGIYYIYDRPIGCVELSILPGCFASKRASRYLTAIEIMTEYPRSKEKLQPVADWLVANQNENGVWDMGNTVNDGVTFPLSDNWNKKGVRELDCTYRVKKLLEKLEGQAQMNNNYVNQV